MSIKHWSLPRRVTVGFSLMLLIIICQGLFSNLRLGRMDTVLVALTDNTLPSVETLGDLGSAIREQFLASAQISALGAGEEGERKRLQGVLQDKEKHIRELLQHYQSALIHDAEDKRLFEAIAKARDDVAATNARLEQLVLEGDMKEYQRLASDVQPANRARLLAAISAASAYNQRLGREQANAGRAEVAGMRKTRQAVVLGSVFVAGLLAWLTLGATLRTLKRVSSDLDRGALQTAATASQVATLSHSLATGASEQAAAVEETSASLEEMLSMVHATADNTQKAKQIASEARQMAESGQQTATAMHEAITQIGESGQQVAKIVKQIDEIAFQTNILAVNAAVEAARAGEAVAGFAVIADEVRALAQRSAEAARETAEKLEAANSATRHGRQCSVQVERALQGISEKIVATDQIVGEIATAAREQAQGITQVGSAITQIDRISQGNSSTADQSTSASEQLNHQAESLRASVSQLQQLAGGTSGNAVAPPVRPRTAATARFRGKVEPRQEVFTRRAPSPALAGRAKPALASIPMPGPRAQGGDDEDANFKRF